MSIALLTSSVLLAAILVDPTPLADPEVAAQKALGRAKAERLVRDLEWDEGTKTPWWAGSLLGQLRKSHVYIACTEAETKPKRKAKSKAKAKAPTPLGCTSAPEEDWHAIDETTLEGLRTLQQEKAQVAKATKDAATKKTKDEAEAKAKADAANTKVASETQRGRSVLDRALGDKPAKRLRITRQSGDGEVTELVGRVRVDKGDSIVFVSATNFVKIPTAEVLRAEKAGHLNSEFWCSDMITICWDDQRTALSGLRLLLEPNFSYTVPFQGEQGFAFSTANVGNSVAVGLETNLIGGWLSAQAFFITPHSSQLTNLNAVADTDVQVATATAKAGLGLGFSTLNGALALGYGFSFWDRSTLPDFASELSDRRGANSGFLYFAIQPASLARTAITGIKKAIEDKKESSKQAAATAPKPAEESK